MLGAGPLGASLLPRRATAIGSVARMMPLRHGCARRRLAAADVESHGCTRKMIYKWRGFPTM